MQQKTIEPRKINNPALNVVGIEGGYHNVHIIHGIDFCLKDKEITTIIGPNGCGKSTFLKIIFGLATHYKGKVEYFGTNITKNRTDQLVKNGISYVPQVNNVFSDLTILENLQMGAYLSKKNYQDDIEKVYQIFPELQARKHELAVNLSGGQRQMLALGRALMTKPKILLLDEPTAALSPIFVKEILEKIQDLREEGLSILLVEQNARSALQHSDYCYIFAAGNVITHAPAEEVLSNKNIGQLFLGIMESETRTL
jgi:branched-chain amino acid transport system ATP-binding protein